MLAFVSHFSREYVEYDFVAALCNADCVYCLPSLLMPKSIYKFSPLLLYLTSIKF